MLNITTTNSQVLISKDNGPVLSYAKNELNYSYDEIMMFLKTNSGNDLYSEAFSNGIQLNGEAVTSENVTIKMEKFFISSCEISDYQTLKNKPAIEGIILQGNKTLSELGIDRSYSNIVNFQVTQPVTTCILPEKYIISAVNLAYNVESIKITELGYQENSEIIFLDTNEHNSILGTDLSKFYNIPVEVILTPNNSEHSISAVSLDLKAACYRFPRVTEGLVGYWNSSGKSNDDPERNILHDLSGNGRDLYVQSNFNNIDGYRNEVLELSDPSSVIQGRFDSEFVNGFTIVLRRRISNMLDSSCVLKTEFATARAIVEQKTSMIPYGKLLNIITIDTVFKESHVPESLNRMETIIITSNKYIKGNYIIENSDETSSFSGLNIVIGENCSIGFTDLIIYNRDLTDREIEQLKYFYHE